MKMDEDMQAMRRDLEQIIGNGAEVWQRQSRAHNVRFNIWANQSHDGRKHDEDAMPFPGCADTRIPLLDGIISDEVDFVKLAFFRGTVQGVPVEPGDAAKVQNTNTLLKWLRDCEMRDELETEVELSAQYLFGDDPGVVILAIDWRRDTNLKRLTVNFDDLAGMYATGAETPAEIDWQSAQPELLGDFTDLATNPAREREFLAWLEQLMPLSTVSGQRKVMRDLRKTGEAVLPIPEIRENRPSVSALRYFDEIFFPVGTADLQRARNIHRREWLNENELRERVLTHRWNPDVVEQIIQKGRGQTIVNGHTLASTLLAAGISLSGIRSGINETQHLFEIWWSYERRTDDLGISGLNCEVWNIAATDSFTDDPCDFPDGEYPFVMRTRERLGRQVTDSRGTTVALATHQTEMKTQRDARSNFTQMSASPPKKVKMARGAWELIISPNAEIPVNKMDDFEWAPPPNQLPQASIEMEKTTKAEADEYIGRMLPGIDPDRASTKLQARANNFLALWKAAFRKILYLCQHYYTDADLARVTGDDRTPSALTADSVGGRYDVLIEIDSRDLNMEFAMKKLDAFTKIKALDTDGRLGTDGLVEWATSGIDPILARKALLPLQTVQARERSDEQGNVAKMALGIEPDMPTEGINAQFRMQVMMQTIGQSPKLAAAYQADANFRALLQNRQKYLVQQIQQDRNKIIGTTGAMPLQQGVQTGGPAQLGDGSLGNGAVDAA